MDIRALTTVGEDPRTVLAVFGGFAKSLPITELFNVSISLFDRIGVPVNVAAVHVGRKYGRYQQSTAQLLQPVRTGKAHGFSLVFVPNSEEDVISLGQLTAETTSGGFIVSGRTDLLPPSLDMMVDLSIELARCFPIVYGYQYQIDAAYGPTFHATGMFYSSMKRRDIPKLPATEQRRTSNWSNKRNRLMATGGLRDVFPLNILTEIHRQRVIDGTPLFNWIRQDDSRGRLEVITSTLWAWHVPEEKCVELGDTFEAAGLFAPEPF